MRGISLFSKKAYCRSEIEFVKREWEAGVYLKLTSGGWVEIPGVLDSKKLVPTLRTWLNEVKEA